MLLAINEKIKGWLGAVVVGFIALPFALWGIQSYIGGGTEQIAASVGDREISIRELEQTTSQLRQQLEKNSSNLPADQVLQRRALDQLINTTILETETLDQGYRISDQLLAVNVKQIFTRDGEFDKDYFVRALASQGMTPQMFEQRYRSELRIKQQQDAISNSTIVSDAELRRLIQLDQQTREFAWLELNVDKLASDVSVSDDEVKQYYDANINSFMTTAQVSVEYIELTEDDLPKQEVDEEALRLQYDEYVAASKQKEERKASHILIGTGDNKEQARQKITEVQAKLSAGGDFAALAKEFSEDPGSAQEGGDLGWVTAGQMVKPFEDAVFDLEENSVSGIVETEFGFHLIKLDESRGAEVKSFADMREQLVRDSQLSAIDSAMYEFSELLASSAYENPDSLEPAAEALNLSIKSSDMFSRMTGDGIAQNEAVRKAAFSELVLKQGENSEPIEVARNHVIILRIKKHEPASPLALDEVSNTIVETLKVTKGEKITRILSEQLIAKLEAGASIDEVLQAGVSKHETVIISNSDTGETDKYLARAVMDMAPPTDGKPSYKHIGLASGDGALVVLQKVNLPVEVDELLLQQTRARFKQLRGVGDFNAMVDAYKDQYAININQKVFEQ